MSSQHRECYGRIFPDLDTGSNEPKGHVFGIKFSPAIGMVRPRAEAQVNIEEWEECLKCEEFTHCLDLGTSRLVLQASQAAFVGSPSVPEPPFTAGLPIS